LYRAECIQYRPKRALQIMEDISNFDDQFNEYLYQR
jgi:hypothetical protein